MRLFDNPRRANVLLWTAQIVVAIVFLFAGGSKIAMSLDALARVSPFPAPFMKFIGVCELLGAIGLILPGLLHIRPGLTPLAAAGLTIIVIGATVVTILTMSVTLAALPFVTMVLSAFIAYGRWRRVPLGGSGESATVHPGH